MKYWAILLLLAHASIKGLAQKNVKIEIEKIKEQCKNSSIDSRLKITVARFSATAPQAYNELGDNMATMLTNALQGINCYRVLEQLSNLNDLRGENDFAQSDESNGEATTQQGRMLAANLIFTGEVTEYSVRNKSAGVGILRSNKNIIKLGFVLKVINPLTREILDSKSINVEGQANGGTSLGFGTIFGPRIELAGSASKDPAIANALEQGIIEAVEFLGKKSEEYKSLSLTVKNTSTVSTFAIQNCDFETISLITEKLKSESTILSIKKSVTNGNGVLRIEHTGSTDDLITLFQSKTGKKYTVKEFNGSSVVLTQKQ